ncbi:P-loop ATPase, Sll1717 family [Planobispora takensis]|uniref:Uncharacterized protein n=1 Tax=Planobispora takensis TaxID=1367882 RepID=A0A8J3SZB7_9ACTN|nr:hypothetical protein [Planobispora takensis]GII02060.1 hypothetical protein Pta02_40680 [Planobispora takensis]
MTGDNGIDSLFTTQHPLGPVAVSDRQSVSVLKALYNARVQLHMESEHDPPTFIVGRRGSGKTALLLSREFDPCNLSVRLSAQGVFSRMQAAAGLIGGRMILTAEGAAQLWELLLWAPIVTRLAGSDREHSDSPRAVQVLWHESAGMRRAADGSATEDDDVLDFATLRLIEHVQDSAALVSLEHLWRSFRLGERPWIEVIETAKEVLKSRRTPVFVLVDSLENIGEHITQIKGVLQGLFHLAGQLGLRRGQPSLRIQCCFPSELWPALDVISANPIKDFSGRVVLRWHWQDLLSAVGRRLRMFLERCYPEHVKDVGVEDHEGLLARVLPPEVRTPAGIKEDTIGYVLRHSQLLPRQVLYMFNEAMHRTLVATDSPVIRGTDIVSAVAEAEGTLCPEVFSAHQFRYPQAHDVARRLIPFLPFLFDDSYLHRMCNQAGVSKSFGLDYREVREMFTDVGIIGKYTGETSRYLKADFAYSAEGQMILSPDEKYCLHPLFVRYYNSRDALASGRRIKPVYPSGTGNLP